MTTLSRLSRAAGTAAASISIREHRIPSADSKPYIAVQGPDGVTAHDGGLRGARRLARAIGDQRHDGIELRIDARDHGEMGVKHLERAHGAGADQSGQLDG